MRVCVLGAGVVGLATAWMLAEAGCEITIVDRETGVGLGASRGNGAQLSYGFVAPFASPETLRHLPAMLAERHGPIGVRPSLDPSFLRWGLAFLRACRRSTARETTVAQLALAASSRAELERIAADQALDFGLRMAGKLVIYRSSSEFASARQQAHLQASHGPEQSVLSPRECLDLEPGLRIAESALAGGIYTPSEQVGDCGAFCDELAERLRRRNDVVWFMGEPATPIVADGRIRAVAVSGQEITADVFVLAMGFGATAFARRLGVRLPIQPMKGYSLTVSPRTPGSRLRHSVTDAARKVVFAPLDDGAAIRVAGIADLGQGDAAIDPRRLASVRRAAEEALDIDWSADTRPWAGIRPATPDSRPIVGWSGLDGLFLNVGHGALGWTLACGTARLAADLIVGREPVVDAGAFSWPRGPAA